ncbi:MAG TPA: carboxypeptidase regulatory-like domain-containing protein [Vicinamibacterales bacterium]
MRAIAWLLLVLLFAVPSSAQERGASLLVTVLDETRGVLPGASVTLVGLDAANKAAVIPPGLTTAQGQVKFENLAPGRYAVTGEFSGFQKRTLPEVKVKAGENRQVLVLPLDRMQSSVTVERDRQQSAADRDVTFGTVLTREQIDALSDDPDELRRQLMDLGGPDAKLIVDSFEGRDLPPKALIKSIRITKDQFAPEAHYAGEFRIEILTQPGIGPLRGNARMGFYDSAMDGRNPLVGETGPAQSMMYGIGLNGTLINERAGFYFNLNGQDSYSTPVIYAAAPGGNLQGNAPVRTPNDNMFMSGGVDYALTRDQVLRVNFNGSKTNRRNLGIGTYDVVGRGYSNEGSSFGLFIQQNGPIGRRFVLNTRLSVTGNDSESRSNVDAQTIVINEAITIGGAQRTGGTHYRNYWLNSDLDYVHGIHSMRTGIELQVADYRTDSNSNYLGTYVFESLDAYEAGRPRSYTQRIGDPRVKYTNVQGGFYVQDDIKVRKGLTVTGGVRYEAQTHVPDLLNFAPRAGLTWAPFKSGKTTLRGSWGIFYDWLSTGTYAQTLQLDGYRQRELNIINPSYPDPGTGGVLPPTNRYLLAEERGMAYSQRLSAGIAQTLSRRITANVLYSYTYEYEVLVGRNLNTPIAGQRPNPEFANVILASPDARGTEHAINASANVNLGPLSSQSPGGGGPMTIAVPGGMMMVSGGGPASNSGPRWQWRRGLTLSGFYTFGRRYDNTDGAFAVPASVNLANEWGPASFDRRHSGFLVVSTGALRNLSARLQTSASSAPPLNIRTGLDDNGDTIFNDRPVGVGRNSTRTRGSWTSSANFGYSFTLGKKQVTSGGGVQIMGSPAGLTVNPSAVQTAPRYRLNVSVNINNLFNRPSYSGFSGIMTSPYFLQPTSASGVRRVTFNASVSF